MAKSAKKNLDEIRARKPSMIDSFASKYFPGWAASREQARYDREFSEAKRGALMAVNNWNGSSKTRNGLKGWQTISASPDSTNNGELPELRDRSLDLARNTAIASGALNNVKMFVVGDKGPTLNAQLDGEALGMSEERVEATETLIQREFDLYFNNVEFDLERSLPGADFCAQTVYSWFASGDVFTIRSFVKRPGSPYGTKFQNIEAALCTNPDRTQDGSIPDKKVYEGAVGPVYAGIERDPQTNAPIAYYFQNKYSLDNKRNTSTAWSRVPAFDAKGRKNVIHMHIKDRPRQSRGVPYLAPIIEPLKQLGRYTDGELMAAVVSGMFTAFVKSDSGRNLNPIAGADATTSDSEGIEMGYGNVVSLKSNESIEFGQPGRPSENFDPFVDSILKQIGLALGQPKEILMKNFQSSYSAARAAMLEAWRYFKTIRGMMERNWLEHVYTAFFEEAVALSRIPAPGYLRADIRLQRIWLSREWVWPAQGMIRPEVEIKAFRQADEGGYMTKENITAQLNGGDYMRNAPQRKKEAEIEKDIKEAGQTESEKQGTAPNEG